MPQISAIEPQKKKKDRFIVYVDGKFAVGLDAETLVKSGIKVGQQISNDEIQNLVLENEVSKLLEKAYRFLSYRPRSRQEVRDYLQRKSKTSAAIRAVLTKLTQLNHINDTEFTKWWVEQRRTHKPRGLHFIRRELYQKGVDRKVIDEVLGEFDNPQKELELAKKAMQRKLKKYEKLEPWEIKRRMGNYLSRRGFGWETINEVLESLC